MKAVIQMQNLETRSFEVRAADTDTRTITGLAVPYNTETNIGDFVEKFERGAFGEISNVKLFYGHTEPIGLVTKGEDTEDGYVIEARISDTPKGNEIYTLLKDGVLNRFSVGFIPVEDRMDDDVVVRTKATLKEVSVVPFPAYEGAEVLAVRGYDSTKNSVGTATENTNNEKGDINMSEITYASSDDVADLRTAVDEMERRMALAGTSVNDNAAPQFRSGGDFLKALADGDAGAQNAVRAYTGATLSDSHTSNDWKANLLTIVDRGRPVLNLFSRGPLGPSGNSVEYPKVSALTGDVAKQVAEGDNLAYLEVGITTATAPVETFGGYSELSRQAIERSDVSYLDTVLRYQAASYAKVTNAKVLSAMTAATAQAGTSFTLSSATAANFLDAVVDGVAKIDANGQGAQADFIAVSPDVYAKLATVAGSQFALDANNSGGATIGSVNVRGISGSLAGVPIVVVAGMAAKSFYVASSTAVTSWENSGAPLRLQDENIINLTKQFSLYGYLAVGVTNANGLVKATVA
ncbi:HK97 family phage prohead protease [Nocardioides sp. Leaf307]|uniref:HK97 family phage prohead protease n=1 Tax=Nocardioides sp. Leaf307 TaxID=1736331 RepID=UPI0009E9E1DB|nr:HK97 family phage prohead protease [Nocardioides sp. Leaf307]